uniref:F-box protein n=1 Tax=Rosa rugosa TaxID=74645 RepID=J7G0U1_ROSRU|nr:F-box protein [Rosa rugosa]
MFNLHIDPPKLENLHIEKPFLPSLFLENAKPSLAIFLYQTWECLKDILLSLPNMDLDLILQFGFWLKFLRLSMCLSLLMFWSSSAPNLEDIVLEDETKDDREYSELHWNPPEVVPGCLLSHLKTISIHGFKGQRIEIEVTEYLLFNGYLLNKLTITYSIDLSDEENE